MLAAVGLFDFVGIPLGGSPRSLALLEVSCGELQKAAF